jgi:nicotinamidase-related amidase
MSLQNRGRLHREKTSLLMVDVQERLLPLISGHEAVLRNVVRRFEKTAFSCCDEPGFIKVFQATMRESVVIFGIESHICVLSTVQDLLGQDLLDQDPPGRGRQIVLAADACGSRSPENHRLALDDARTRGAVVLPTETVIYQLLGRSGTPEFKTLLPLFK